VFWVFVFPVIVAVGLGIAFRQQGPARPQVAVDLALRETAPDLYAALLSAPNVDARPLDEATATAGLRRGGLDLIVSVQSTSAGDGAGDSPPPVRYRYDESRPEGRLARWAVDDVLQRSQGRQNPLTVEDDRVTEPGGRYIDFLLPGLIGLNIMGSSMWGIGFAVVMMRKRRQLRSYAVTPMRRSHYLLAFMLSRLIFLVMEVGALLAFGFLAFGVALHGSWAAVGLLALAGAVCFAGLSLLVAARTESIEAASGWMNLVQLPMWLLSGSFFAYERFPEIAHPFIRLLPLTTLNDALRAVINDGASLVSQVPALTALTLWGGCAFLLALRFFRWQ
jgi:ABC-type multidrug transport system permease subunit